MTTDEAREIQSKVMKLAHQLRQHEGRRQLSRADVDVAYLQLFARIGADDYASLPEWKKAVISMSMIGDGSHTHPNNGQEKREKKGFLNRYTELAMRRDFLPDDEFLEETWGAGDGTFSSIRNRLRKRGWDFLGAEGRTWKVTARPQPEPEPEPVKPAAPIVTLSTPGSSVSMSQQVEKWLPLIPFETSYAESSPPQPTDSDRLETIIALLRELLAVWTR